MYREECEKPNVVVCHSKKLYVNFLYKEKCLLTGILKKTRLLMFVPKQSNNSYESYECHSGISLLSFNIRRIFKILNFTLVRMTSNSKKFILN